MTDKGAIATAAARDIGGQVFDRPREAQSPGQPGVIDIAAIGIDPHAQKHDAEIAGGGCRGE